MARPRKFDRDNAVDVAMNEFWQHGYSAVSVKSLCEKLGITRSSFYNSFGSIDALFEEALNCYLIHNPMRLLDSPETSATYNIRQFFQLLCKLRAKDSLHRGCLIINNLGGAEKMARDTELLLEGKIELSIQRLESSVLKAVEQGELDVSIVARELALCLQTLATGLNTLSMQVHKEQELWCIADTTLSALGFKPDEPPNRAMIK